MEATQGLMPAIDVADFAGWKAKIEELVASAGVRKALREQITKNYRRTTVTDTFEQVLEFMRS